MIYYNFFGKSYALCLTTQHKNDFEFKTNPNNNFAFPFLPKKLTMIVESIKKWYY